MKDSLLFRLRKPMFFHCDTQTGVLFHAVGLCPMVHLCNPV